MTNWRRVLFTILYLLSERIDLTLEWIHLRLQTQVLRFEGLYLRFHIRKLRIERGYLSLILRDRKAQDNLRV